MVSTKQQHPSIEEYLSTPGRKKKRYVVLAFGPDISRNIDAAIKKLLRQKHSLFHAISPQNQKELLKLVNRHIVLLVIDDSFDCLQTSLQTIQMIKKKKAETGVPVFFLTKDSQKLIENYHKFLNIYQELDEYLEYQNTQPHTIIHRINNALVKTNRRRSHRYPISIPIMFFLLEKNAKFQGAILNISFHGALLKATAPLVFHMNDQLKIFFPTTGYLPTNFGDFIRFSGRIRRVLISGNQAGFSFEYLSEQQEDNLILLLSKISSREIYRQRLGDNTKNECLPHS